MDTISPLLQELTGRGVNDPLLDSVELANVAGIADARPHHHHTLSTGLLPMLEAPAPPVASDRTPTRRTVKTVRPLPLRSTLPVRRVLAEPTHGKTRAASFFTAPFVATPVPFVATPVPFPRVRSRKRAPDTAEREGCACRKTRCLKKYCECFANGLPCQSLCVCYDCYNQEHSLLRRDAMRKLESRGTITFRKASLKQRDAQALAVQGCNCKRSRCIKKYCECFAHGLRCADPCTCVDCHNNKL